MSILDLQGMETVNKAPSGSRTSKGCVVQSNVSLILCILVL
jgi:SapB morphogen precursor RamS